MASRPRINADRLNETLQTTCTQWGALAAPSTGMCRLTMSQEDKAVRDWLVGECERLGCEVKIDQMGNIFATRPGTAKDLLPIGMGSHLDTQPDGGRYDGILGVQAALEVLRTLHENEIQTHSPITLIDWANEEGARFPGAMMASGIYSTKSSMTLEDNYAQQDCDGVSIRSALESIGYLGTVPCDYRANPLACHFELHIEQGPRLERAGQSVGVVTGVQGMKWVCVRVTGVEGHTGTAAMAERADALVTASRLITAVRDAARGTGLGVATVGVIRSDSESMCIIPGGIEFIIDIRCPTDDAVEALSAAIFAAFDAIMAEENNATTYQVTKAWGLPEARFHESCVDVVRAAARAEVPESDIMEMQSRAGHDSAWVSKVIPTSMIFVPSKNGLSHNPNEYTHPDHCALGTQVLLNAILAYDEKVKDGQITQPTC